MTLSDEFPRVLEPKQYVPRPMKCMHCEHYREHTATQIMPSDMCELATVTNAINYCVLRDEGRMSTK